jgi:Holliday junction resolvase RusA-like endonuclease
VNQETWTQADYQTWAKGGHVPRKPARRFSSTITSITITLPLPPAEMYPNARKHWRAKMKPKKQQRNSAYAAAMDALESELPPRWKLAECQATFYLERRRDGDNLAAWLKATMDGLQDAGIVANDSGFIHLPPIQHTAKAANGERKVVLQITERKEL